ncbi:unnamed protein product, partial [Aphanomyces euteiches]
TMSTAPRTTTTMAATARTTKSPRQRQRQERPASKPISPHSCRPACRHSRRSCSTTSAPRTCLVLWLAPLLPRRLEGPTIMCFTGSVTLVSSWTSSMSFTRPVIPRLNRRSGTTRLSTRSFRVSRLKLVLVSQSTTLTEPPSTILGAALRTTGLR